MHNGDCYPNGSYFHDDNINGVISSIQCVLPGSTLNGGELVAPSGSSVNCSTNPLHCNVVSSPANISLYKNSGWPSLILASLVNLAANNLTWDEVNCSQHNV